MRSIVVACLPLTGNLSHPGSFSIFLNFYCLPPQRLSSNTFSAAGFVLRAVLGIDYDNKTVCKQLVTIGSIHSGTNR